LQVSMSSHLSIIVGAALSVDQPAARPLVGAAVVPNQRPIARIFRHGIDSGLLC